MTALIKLQKMLALEIEQGYQNKAVIGGLEGVLGWWPEQIRAQCVVAEQEMVVKEVMALVSQYKALTADERPKIIDEIQAKLARIASLADQQEEQVAGSPSDAPSPPPATSSSKPATQAAASPASQPSTEASEDKSVSRLGLDSPVTALSGIGATQSKRLERLGVETIHDMLYLFPHRYDDYSQLKPIVELKYGEYVTVIGTIRATKLKRHHGGAAIVNTIVADGSGTIQVTWFNQPYLTKQLKRGRQIVLSGKVDEYLGRPVMSSPTWEPLEVEQIHTGRIVPVYPLTKGLKPRWLRRMMKRVVDYWTKRLPDYLPTRIRERLDLMTLEEAVSQMHFPDHMQRLAQARRRLAFDEFFILQIGVLAQRRIWRSNTGLPIPTSLDMADELLSGLSFDLTVAQRRVLDEILQDMADTCPMSRMLQGDVGSGKTVVAAAAMFLTAKAGYQAAIMAPTEILAEQHFNNLSRLLGQHGIRVCLLTGSLSQGEKDAVYQEISAGEIQVLVGTHAIIQEGVIFENLGLVVVDEQHRFGVRQRGTLRTKGADSLGVYVPHMLVMSATPIPRTLALTAYGDLDLSIIDEMPPGRQPIQTKWFMPAERGRAYRFIRSQVEQGRQAYIICPLVEESDKIEAKAAVEEHQRLEKVVFPDLRLGLLHGRLKNEEKEQVMRQFSNQELDILVSTSVVEVGIDVPNATVMLIEGANRFGLSQLHQFRGRVGRGAHQSYCILISDTVTDASEERLRVIEENQDGFVLAQKDLEMRGPGDFFGTRQSGLPALKLASLGDTPLLELARREAKALFQQDPTLSHPDHRLLAAQVDAFWGGEGDLS